MGRWNIAHLLTCSLVCLGQVLWLLIKCLFSPHACEIFTFHVNLLLEWLSTDRERQETKTNVDYETQEKTVRKNGCAKSWCHVTTFPLWFI